MQVSELEDKGISLPDGVDCQYISFRVDSEIYALEITQVREIRGWQPTTSLPNSPEFMRGVLNLRGIIVPVFDLRARFGKGLTIPGKTHVVIIVKVEERTVGILVDAVLDILNVQQEDVCSLPDADQSPEHIFLAGLLPGPEGMVALLRPEYLFDWRTLPEEQSETDLKIQM